MTSPDFSVLLANHHSYLQPYAQTLTGGDRAEADDLCQETMLRALLYADKYEMGTNLRAWLYTIMRNTFINAYRRGRRIVKLPTEASIENAYEAAGLAARNEGYGRIRVKEILRAVDSLPQSLRMAFELYYSGYKYAEIAGMLGEPLGTVKSRIHFARKALMAGLER